MAVLVVAIAMLVGAALALIAAVFRCRPLYLLLTVAFLLGGVVLGLLAVSRPGSTDPVDPNADADFRIATLGDSYASGEGAQRYFVGTDTRTNRCHRAPTAYAYRLAVELGASLTFAACSGAETFEVTRRGQLPGSPANVFGGRPQVDVLREALPVDVVLLGIGGNDAGFAEIGAGCATPGEPDCRRSAAYWLRRLETKVYPALLDTYARVREAAEAPVFVVNYPNPIGPGSCDDILLGHAELSFVRDVFIERLNEVVTHAAAVARVRLINLARSMDGHRICEVSLGRAAVNFVALGRTSGSIFRLTLDDLKGIGNGTFHPNELGHRLMGARVRPALEQVRAGALEPLPPEPSRDLPPYRPKEAGAAVGPHPLPEGTRCQGDEIAVITPMAVNSDVREVEFTDLEPRSRTCFREYRGAWDSRQVDRRGTVRVPVDVRRPGVGSLNEILVRKGSLWSKVLVSGTERASDADPPPKQENVLPYVVGGGVVLLVAGLALVAVVRCRRSRATGATAPPAPI